MNRIEGEKINYVMLTGKMHWWIAKMQCANFRKTKIVPFYDFVKGWGTGLNLTAANYMY